ncbi:LSU ribosomal protein L4P [Chthonomonas calidirosea]|uniref:50S ribosomal protein L4 n=1 Tax=Chthonomonas calidirosea TaxID=454171 RepID=UPI0006DD4E1E|nr:50S ribosomal protein L4 [Chthonomonas calidirosea]CEK15601.1 LSU ribosomal protein L4P [Chthonomonas calidirosea]
MASVPLYNMEGNEIGSLSLPDSIFDVEFREALVHQVVVAEEANQRQGTHDTKQRSEVRGGGRKPWRQKGTGRARQGSIRAPHWRGGGVVFGPHPRDYRKDLPVKMRRSAMRSALSAKVREGAVIGLEKLAFDAIKTKQAAALLKALGLESERRVLIIVPEYDKTALLSTRNLPMVTLRYAPNFSVRDVMVAHKIVLVAAAVEKIAAAWAPEESKEEVAVA